MIQNSIVLDQSFAVAGRVNLHINWFKRCIYRLSCNFIIVHSTTCIYVFDLIWFRSSEYRGLTVLDKDNLDPQHMTGPLAGSEKSLVCSESLEQSTGLHPAAQ